MSSELLKQINDYPQPYERAKQALAVIWWCEYTSTIHTALPPLDRVMDATFLQSNNKYSR